MKKVRKFTSRLTVKLTILVVCLILPVNLLAIQFMVNMSREMREQTRLSIKNVVDVYTSTLNGRMTAADNYLYQILNKDPDGMNLFATTDSLEYQNAKVFVVQKMLENLPEGNGENGYFIYLKETGDFLFACTSGNLRAKQAVKAYLQENISTEQPGRSWNLAEIGGERYALRVTQLRSQVEYGAFLDLSELETEISGDLNYEQTTVEFTEDIAENTDAAAVHVYGKAEKASFYLRACAENVSLLKDASMWRMVQILLVALCLAAAPILYLFLRKSVMAPVRELNEAHHQLEIGNRDYRIEKTADSSEMQSAFSSFNQMADNIKDLRVANMEKELARQKLELQNLQLQIRPHFLLNTFNLMYNLASKGETKSIQELILYLSNYFRYIFRSGKSLELFEKELRLIEGYMDSVKIRYPGRVEIQYEIDPDIFMVRVPPLLIHNFIENVIKHGLPDDGGVNIVLSAEYADGQVVFEISDDGKGMPAEQAAQINAEYIEQDDGQNVGLRNSLKRLKVFYGESARIRVESELGVGTTFTITFPYDLEEKET
ncbi:MAG: histidine kinase [Eubacteriales bacterium]|nr:histidine kinase [Eubacteriales bacterium]